MTRSEAHKLLQDGKKITHTYFTDNEYVYISERTGLITTEDGFDFTEQWWEVERFKDGWSEYIHETNDREKSMTWWGNLNPITKMSICDNTKELIGGIRNWETLTGREIEKLYKSTKL